MKNLRAVRRLRECNSSFCFCILQFFIEVAKVIKKRYISIPRFVLFSFHHDFFIKKMPSQYIINYILCTGQGISELGFVRLHKMWPNVLCRNAQSACVQAHCQCNVAQLTLLRLSGRLDELSKWQKRRRPAYLQAKGETVWDSACNELTISTLSFVPHEVLVCPPRGLRLSPTRPSFVPDENFVCPPR